MDGWDGGAESAMDKSVNEYQQIDGPDGTVSYVDTSLDSALHQENITVVGDKLALEATEDRIIIKEDPFRTGFECSQCDGDMTVTCSRCSGTGKSNFVEDAACPECKGKKLVTCSLCEGKGGLLIAPEISQKRPSSGIITSVGPLVNKDEWGNQRKFRNFNIGDRVLYNQFIGTGIDFKQRGTVRIMRAHEISARIYGVGELGKSVK